MQTRTPIVRCDDAHSVVPCWHLETATGCPHLCNPASCHDEQLELEIDRGKGSRGRPKQPPDHTAVEAICATIPTPVDDPNAACTLPLAASCPWP